MEPERNIEKLLRAYAKKRKAQAGDPLKLHPVTRRMLLDEVARATPKLAAEDESLSRWELIRQQWAMLLGFALIIFFVATMFLPAIGSSKKKAQLASTTSNLKQVGLAAQISASENSGKLPASLDALTNGLVSEKTLRDADSGKQFIYVAGGAQLDDLPSNTVLAYSATDKKERAVLFADGHVDVMNGAQLSALTNRGQTELALAKAIAARRLDEKPAGEISDRQTLARADGVTFASASAQSHGLNVQKAFKNTLTPAKPQPVLANFQVQQNGNAIRVVDADGSVYNGELLTEISLAQNAPAPAAPAIIAPAQIEQQNKIANRDESQLTQNYSFRVAGTNRTLKQNVVFTGNLLANSSTDANQAASFNRSKTFGGGGGGGGGASGSQMQAAVTNLLPWANARIAGTAILGDTNNIEVNAVPTTP